MNKRITVVGSANIDLTFRAARLPKPGETVFGSGYFQGFGGKGANQAVAAARLGATVSFVGCVGDDDFGRSIRAQLVREGIDVTHLTVDRERPTGTAAILVDDAGENAIVGVAGANLGLTPQLVRAARDLLTTSVIILAPCETMIETLTEAFQIAHGDGRLCILNPAPARELPNELLRNIDLLVPNETELQQLTRLPTDSPEAVTRAARQFGGTGGVVVTLGSRGAQVVAKDGTTPIDGMKVKARDTSGAGDAFCGALATYLAQGDRLAEAAQKANRAAAISVTRLGTQSSFPSLSELS